LFAELFASENQRKRASSLKAKTANTHTTLSTHVGFLLQISAFGVVINFLASALNMMGRICISRGKGIGEGRKTE
jgi:hypothetical protein